MLIKDPNSEHLQQNDSIGEHYMSPTLNSQTFFSRLFCYLGRSLDSPSRLLRNNIIQTQSSF